jgi:squalene-associated FAD-dependent desaturase
MARHFSPPQGREPIIHVIGAGLAGLAAAARLAERGHAAVLHEAAGQAGGRCRSYFDASFGAVIDNGNHLLLSGNGAAMGYLDLIGAADKLSGPERAEFAFADLKSGERWTLRVNDGRWPAWVFDPSRRVPGTKPLDYLAAAPLMWAGRKKTVTDVIGHSSILYTRLWHPLMLAALNTDPEEGSARLAGAIMRNTLVKGGAACRPLVAAEGLSSAFVEPGLRYIEGHGGSIHLNHRLRELKFENGRVSALDFGPGGLVPVSEGDSVILAVPSWAAETLVPGLEAPTEFRAILNVHYRVTPSPDIPEIVGVINGTVEWIFAFHGRVSITISGADRLIDQPREQIAADLWREVSAITGLSGDLPPWQVVKEKRATFAALPGQDARRPPAHTKWRNLYLAGDWTQTGLPATIEGAIRSGERAARLAAKGHFKP